MRDKPYLGKAAYFGCSHGGCIRFFLTDTISEPNFLGTAAVAAPFVQRVCARKIAEFGYLLRKAMMVCICMY